MATLLPLEGSPLAQLRRQYNLEKMELKKQVSDRHIQEFSTSHGRRWQSLPSHLELDQIVADDIDCKPIDEDKKRHSFLSRWKRMNGTRATYKVLVCALLKIQ